MASISLRAYHRQIEEWIEQALYDQAILHCRHILKFYPKCLDTYRILGKAFLESQKFGDAADIFQRVLSSQPDDFISHVGMSIIREDEGNLNEAIWHMERAFEIQPSNNAIQGELRRLYGRRDGIEPPKVNLNRSALARMYLKGNLYSQAIAEIRMALAEDPQRPDLDVLLAKAYFVAQQIPEAKQVANQILAKLPFCYDAIFILWQIALSEGKERDAEKYLNRLAELDPYAAHMNKNVSSIELVPDTAVLLEKMEEKPSIIKPTASQQPDWAASLGIQIGMEEETPTEAPIPDWLTEKIATSDELTERIDEQESEPLLEPGETPLSSITASEIPDWMRDLGWEESKPEEEQPEAISAFSPFTEETDLEELEAGEIPDWLKEISPAEDSETLSIAAEAVEPSPYLEEPHPSDGDRFATWLAGIESEKEEQEEIPLTEAEEVPDWLQELNDKSNLTVEISSVETEWSQIESSFTMSPEPPSSLLETAATSQTAFSSAEELPAWLTEEEPLENANQLPDWLMNSYDEEALPSSTPTIPPPSEEDTKPVKVQSKEETSVDQPTPVIADEDAFAWLESLAAKQGAQEALLLSPEERKEEPPEWIREYLDSQPDLQESKISLEEGAPFSEAPEIPVQELAEAPQEFELPRSADQEPISEELPAWLRAELEKESRLETPISAESSSELPEWLSSPTAQETEEWIHEFSGELSTEIAADATATSDISYAEVVFQTQEIPEVEQSVIPKGESAQENPIDQNFVGTDEISLPFVEAEEETSISLERQELFSFEAPKPEGATDASLRISPADEIPVPSDREETLTAETQARVQETVAQEIPEGIASVSMPIEGVEVSQLETLSNEARLALSAGKLDQALEKYQALIKRRIGLDQIIEDLSNALYQHPMEVRMWMLLGDAYLRKDLLSEALDAYNKAEELLR
ncbi:MAG: hypothetical protein DDG59_06450 [Anaerolineae bacterium]|jgi:tetratricopeptide (TPR) repeat protein|nr:MAG: hypothetical protein DDG59_06450 [Anaerolineae bacterium]